MIDIARDRAKAAVITNVTFEVQAANVVDAPDASLDVVMAHNLLHLLDDREQVIGIVYRKLKPGGSSWCSTS